MIRQPIHRRVSVVAALVCALLAGWASPAWADPDEGKVGDKLDQAIDDYVDAEETLKSTEKRQEEIKDEISDGKKRIKELKVEVNEFAEAAYKNGGLPESMSILASGSPKTAVDTISTLNYLGEQSGEKLAELTDARSDLEAQQDSLEDEKEEAEKAKDKMESARDEAARDLAAAGGQEVSGPAASDAPAAEPVPRNSDGSLPDEGCSETDPTTDGGCISPRTKHSLEQAVLVGFQRETSCYRSLQDGGDHPKGKACDFTVGANGGHAQGEALTYGDNLAAWFVENADALGIRVVIWNNEIWNPLRGGWHSYSGGYTGDPNMDHTNHVHLSLL